MKTINSISCPTNGLVMVNHDQVVTTSLKVAEYFGKRHSDVLRAIKNLTCSDQFQQRNFALMVEMNKLPQGGSTKKEFYYLTRDGFTLLVMGFTGKIAARFKEAYINAFNEMENKLRGITINEEEITKYLRELCEDMDKRMKAHDREIREQYKCISNPAVISPLLFCSGTLKDQLKYIFAVLNNDILAGQFAWGKLEKVEKENKEMKKALANVANEFLNYY